MMKQMLIRQFWPLSRIFETGEEAVGYKLKGQGVKQ